MIWGKLAAGVLACTIVMTTAQTTRGQGCVAVRPMGCAASDHMMSRSEGLLEKGEWQVSGSYQYFRSFRHFRGGHEEANRVDDGTEVINLNHSTDLGLSYGVNDRLSVRLNVPLIYYDRSSLYEHYGNNPERNPTQARFHTGSTGLGDVRLSANYWLFDPVMPRKGNLSLGFGIKAPTGDSNVQDTFHKKAADGSDSLVTKAVDQSIQLGDGGWGFTVQGEGYRSLLHKVSGYFNAFYLFNPREVNDTRHNASTFHSVADQYFARAGLSYSVLPAHGFSASLGGRVEGIPAEDLIGGNEGRRRPGYTISIEPGLAYAVSGVNLSLEVPIALYRNRTQSVQDKERTAETGVFTQGDAAFADYLINFSITKQFGKSHHDMMMD